jgi:hypothetical protein
MPYHAKICFSRFLVDKLKIPKKATKGNIIQETSRRRHQGGGTREEA